VDQSDIEFLIPAESDTYIHLNIILNVSGKLSPTDVTDLEETDYTGVTNNFLHSLFSKSSLTLNDSTIKQTIDLYQYRTYLETLLTYGSDGATSQLTNEFWYLDNGDLLPCEHTEAESRNTVFIARWTLVKKSKELLLLDRLHCFICNVIPYLLPGVTLQIKFIKADGVLSDEHKSRFP
jgi:hypothetical protein